MSLVAVLMGACVSKLVAGCDVTHPDYGAVGDGMNDDTSSIQAVLDDPKCPEVLFPAGKKFKAGSLHLTRSNVVLTLENDSELEGDEKHIKQCDDEADWRGWCSFFTVDSAENVTIRGNGTLAGGGKQGQHWSTLHIRSTVGVDMGGGGTRIYCTNSWWCTVMHNASNVYIHELFIDGSKGRDGLDLVNSREILIENSRIEGSDDGLCFKTQADSGLSEWIAESVYVRDSYLSSHCCNAIQFGSRTEVDMLVLFGRFCFFSLISSLRFLFGCFESLVCCMHPKMQDIFGQLSITC